MHWELYVIPAVSLIVTLIVFCLEFKRLEMKRRLMKRKTPYYVREEIKRLRRIIKLWHKKSFTNSTINQIKLYKSQLKTDSDK